MGIKQSTKILFALLVACAPLAHAQSLPSSVAQEDFSDIEAIWPELEIPSVTSSGGRSGSMNGTLRGVNPANPKALCKAPQYVSASPFFVSSLLNDYDKQPGANRRITEPLSYILQDGKIARKGVPAFSIIKLIAPENLSEMTAAEIAKIDASVEVISLPNEESIKEMRTNSRLAGAAKALPIAEEGATGKMKASVIKNVSQFVFKIKDPAILKNFPRLEDILKDTSISFSMKDGLYLARECCTGAECRREYVFEVNPDQSPEEELKRYFDNSPNDDLFSALFPIQKENLSPLAKILQLIEEPQFDFIDFRYFDTRGFVKIPLEPRGSVLDSKGVAVAGMQRGPLNTVHYKSDDPNANDAYGHPGSICAFFQAIKEFNKTCTTPACQLQWGDFYHSDRWYTHADHVDGSCVDIRPVRKREGYGSLNIFGYVRKCKKDKDGKETCSNVSYLNSEYDREKTKELVGILAAAGGVGKADPDGKIKIKNILFNDTKGVPGVTRAEGHHNHMHVCFPPASPKVREACERAVTP